jgi:hypothetical protein
MRKSWLGAWLALAAAIAGCAGTDHRPWRLGDQTPNDTDAYALRFVESDDEGWFWDRQQALDAVQLIRDKVRERPTLVVTFVHGWHHSAECCDDNVEGFRRTLETLSTLMNARSSQRFNIVGLYIGWRGQSLPMPLDYFTFWGRKGAAERVGQNDMKEFLARLQQLYAEHRPDVATWRRSAAADTPPADGHFLGMITLGHSFGAQVLLKAVAGSLEDRLQNLNPNPAYLRNAPIAAGRQLSYNVLGVGDLMVLINPAVEAAQYQRLYILSQGLKYAPLQNPIILTLSAENDKSRHRLFTFGRMLGEFFGGKPHKEDEVERTVERQALGVYKGHVTHRLVPVRDDVELVTTEQPGTERNCRNSGTCEFDWGSWRGRDRPADSTCQFNTTDASNIDFSQTTICNEVKLERLTPQIIEQWPDDPALYGRAQDYQPLIVARVSKEVIDDHSGIFTTPLLEFLAPYIAAIELKSQANVQQNRRNRAEATR